MPYAEHHVDAVRRFNTRLDGSNRNIRLSEPLVSSWLPRLPGRRVYQEYFVAEENGGAIRGGYILKHQQFLVGDRVMPVGICQSPISEGIVEPRYAIVGALLLRDALVRQPHLYALGMGGLNEPYPRLLRALHWNLTLVPFYFKIFNLRAFVKNTSLLRKHSLVAHACDMLDSRAGNVLAIAPAQRLLRTYSFARRCPTVERIEKFDQRADALWEVSKSEYSMAAVRDAETLNNLYPKENRVHRLLMTNDGEPLGWAVVLATQMHEHPHFGDMHVGTLVDCVARPGYEVPVVLGSMQYLQEHGVDLIVSSQNHVQWRNAMRRVGFLRGPSNFVLGISPALERYLTPLNDQLPRVHITRGDGDGPINL